MGVHVLLNLLNENRKRIIVGHPEPEKKSVGIFEYILAYMLKMYHDEF